MKMSSRCRNLKSPIRDIVAAARKLQAAGKKIYFFNIGDPNKFDFDTPDYLKDGMKRALDEGAGHYSDSEGDHDLKKAVSEKENRTCGTGLEPHDVIITSGISEGVNFLFHAIIEPGRGDEILMPGPPYSVYPQMAAFASGRPISYRLIEEQLWQTDIDDLRKKVTPRTKAICAINPNNPTGSVLHRKALQEII
ncbi:MAG: aminotransferase class I/II-fold pyridoxal phosphate-dependent enzyme, partial [Candidatus Aenigmarchaeota archaeon]|nr:aminotransferase class I/II-fold pyridoxal phosphate-dependent enzyme [Candidatus Aenigmarchaeota archaeon]